MDYNNNNLGAGTMSAPQINYFAYPSEVCPDCGGEIFSQGVVIKKVPGMLLGQGMEEASVPVPVMYCVKCGAMSPYDKKRYDEVTKKAKTTSSFDINK